LFLSVIIPIFNEVKTLPVLLGIVKKELNQLKMVSHFEIILVDDFSTDGTRDWLESQAKNNPDFKVVFHKQNQGKGAALRSGIEKAGGDYILIQDADLEYDPSDYKTVLAPLINEGAHVVYGSRFSGSYNRVLYYWHSLGNKFLTHLSNMFTNLNFTDMETCYKVFSKEVIKNMILTSNRFGFEPEVTAKIAKIPDITIYEVPISYRGRTYAEGKKIGWKDGISALWCIVKFNLFSPWHKSFRKNKNQLLEHLDQAKVIPIKKSA